MSLAETYWMLSMDVNDRFEVRRELNLLKILNTWERRGVMVLILAS